MKILQKWFYRWIGVVVVTDLVLMFFFGFSNSVAAWKSAVMATIIIAGWWLITLIAYGPKPTSKD